MKKKIKWRSARKEMPKIPEGKTSVRVVAVVKSDETPSTETWLSVASLFSDGVILGPCGRLRLVKWVYPSEIDLNDAAL